MSSNSPLDICFQELVGQSSTIKSLTYVQLRNEANAWETFRRIQLYNSNASTLSLPTYQFKNYTEKSQYASGANLYFYYLGYVS